MSCDIHKDMGLLTIVPCSFVAGLQVLDQFSFLNVEEVASFNDFDLIIFSGECLERLTARTFPGCIHRVIKTNLNRKSIVFKLRARPDAIINCEKLLNKNVSTHFKKIETIGEFVQRQLLVTRSVNFPTEDGKAKYLKSILNPNINKM